MARGLIKCYARAINSAMGLQICGKCGRFHYVPGDCPQPKSTAARKVRAPDLEQGSGPTDRKTGAGDPAGTQAPPVDTLKRGMPRIHPDRKAYKAEHERNRRAKLALMKASKE